MKIFGSKLPFLYLKVLRDQLAYFLNMSLLYLQYRIIKDPTEKAELLRQITDTILHRKRLDGSVEIIGLVLFGPENGPSVLNSVRGRGLPLVDDWECLKSMVN